MSAKNTAKNKKKEMKVDEGADLIPLSKEFLGSLIDNDCDEKDDCPGYKEKGFCDLSCAIKP
jgi:hypothetical protein